MSLTDVELEDEGEGLSSHTPQLGGRYVEECNYGGEGEGEEVGVVGDRRGEQRSMTRQVRPIYMYMYNIYTCTHVHTHACTYRYK